MFEFLAFRPYRVEFDFHACEFLESRLQHLVFWTAFAEWAAHSTIQEGTVRSASIAGDGEWTLSFSRSLISFSQTPIMSTVQRVRKANVRRCSINAGHSNLAASFTTSANLRWWWQLCHFSHVSCHIIPSSNLLKSSILHSVFIIPLTPLVTAVWPYHTKPFLHLHLIHASQRHCDLGQFQFLFSYDFFSWKKRALKNKTSNPAVNTDTHIYIFL